MHLTNAPARRNFILPSQTGNIASNINQISPPTEAVTIKEDTSSPAIEKEGPKKYDLNMAVSHSPASVLCLNLYRSNY